MNKIKYAIWWLFYIGEHVPFEMPEFITAEMLKDIQAAYAIPKHLMHDGSHEKETATANRLHI